MLRLAQYLWEMFRWRVVLLAAVMCVSATLEGAGMALLIPFLSTLGMGSSGADLASRALQAVKDLGISPTPWTMGGLLLCVFAVQYGSALAQSWLNARLQADFLVQLRKRVMHAILSARWGFFLGSKNSDALNILYGETQRSVIAAADLLNLSGAVLCAAIYLGLAFLISWKATVLLMLSGTLLAIACLGIMRKSVAVGDAIGKWGDAYLGWCTETLAGMKSIKAQATEGYVGEVFNTINGRSARLFFHQCFIPGILRSVMEGGAVLLLVIAMTACSVSGLDFVELLVLMALFARLYPRLSVLYQGLQSLKMYISGLANVHAFLERLDTWRESCSASTAAPVDLTRAPVIRISDLRVELGETCVLDGISLSLPAGSITAIVGPSGAGKTTLLDSLLRLTDPVHGSIAVNGTPLKDISVQTWRESIGYVGQESVLFNMSIRGNIAWGRDLGDEAIRAAARLANAEDFILAQPNGYETVVGDQGQGISGGQRQRIALARALAGAPILLALDEATSALDPITERAILETIQQFRGKLTVVMVSHRVASLDFADTILVLENGRIAEHGTFQQLRESGGVFSRLLMDKNGPAEVHQAEMRTEDA